MIDALGIRSPSKLWARAAQEMAGGFADPRPLDPAIRAWLNLYRWSYASREERRAFAVQRRAVRRQGKLVAAAALAALLGAA